MIEWLSIDMCTNICYCNRWLQIEPNIYALISSFNCISLIARVVGIYFQSLLALSSFIHISSSSPLDFSPGIRFFLGRSALVLYSPPGFCLYVFLSALWCCSGCSRRRLVVLCCCSSPWLNSLCTCSVSDAHSATTGSIAPLFYV